MASPIKYDRPGIGKAPSASPIRHARQSAEFELQRQWHGHGRLVIGANNQLGHTGAPAAKIWAKLERLAIEQEQDIDLYGRWVGSRLYQRNDKHKGTPLIANEYPPLLDSPALRSQGPQRILGTLQSAGADDPTPTNCPLAMRIAGRVAPVAGRLRKYEHGGVEPRFPPGNLVRVKVAGKLQEYALNPTVSFGPAEILRYNFRDVDDPEKHFARAVELSEQVMVLRDKPKAADMLGDTFGDYGGSHEGLNFQSPPGGTGLPVGKFKFGAIEKDSLDSTDLGKRRRNKGEAKGHREILDKGCHQDLCMDWYLALLYSMATTQGELFYPVAVLLFGALTLTHLDSFYGGQPNFGRIMGPGGWLCVDYRIPFRQCVIQ